ncbi:MAG: SecD/SecF family protein translocase subunit [Gemmiger sp.]|nr:SecD/SecF family protein translocase subunit [Gemmiger sp.]
MSKRGKPWQFIVMLVLIVAFAVTALFGVSYQYGDTKNVYIKGAADIRFGIDIRGGVDVTFMPADAYDATSEQMDAAKTVIEDRLVGLGITDYEDYVDYNKDRIIVRFPWKSGETDFNPQTAIDEIGTTAKMVFRKGSDVTGEEILSGEDVTSATPGYDETNGYVVQLKFSAAGAKAFADATTELAGNGTISIWLDDKSVSVASVKSAITDGNAIIEGNFTLDEVTTLSNQINSGALPFALSAESFSTISPTLGAKSLDVMVMAGLIAFALVALLMIARYRLPGTIAVISLLGQACATLAIVSGYLTIFPGSTLTLPGIAGIILGIGMGVDANVITAERVKEEVAKGKTLDGALASGFKMGLAPIIDGNVTVVIVAAILMGAFGPTDGLWATVFKPIFYWFGPSTAGSIYSFGFTLLTGVLLNFVFGVWATRVMLRGASRIKALRNPWLYGGEKKHENA